MFEQVNKMKHKIEADEFFRQEIKNGTTPNFSISVVKNEKQIYSFVEGNYSEIESQSINSETQFNVGSVTKTVTAALIVKLIEKGVLTLQDQIIKHIPEYKYDEVTIFHLLTHSAGYGDNVNISWPSCPEEYEEFMKSIYQLDVKEKAGEKALYFTLGYCILMDIIQRVTGESIEVFARKTLFDPMGMTRTTYEVSSLMDNHVLPWSKGEQRYMKEIQLSPPTGDSGLYTTATDLIKFGELFLNKGWSNGNQIFDEYFVSFMLQEITSFKFMKTPVFFLKGNKDCYGCFGDLNSMQAVGHTGFSGCMLFIDPYYDMAAAILTNSMYLHSDWSNYRRISNVLMTLQEE